MDEETRLAELGLALPDLGGLSPSHYNAKLYGSKLQLLPNRKVGDLLFNSAVPTLKDKEFYRGRFGDTLTAEDGYKATQIAAVSGLAAMKYALGNLDRVEQILRVIVFVVCTPEFTDLTRVGNGASDLFRHVFGDRGLHSRVDVGMTGIGRDQSIEMIMISKFRD